MQKDANMIYYQHILYSLQRSRTCFRRNLEHDIFLQRHQVAYYAEISAIWLLDTLQKHNIILSRIVVVINEPS
jgi:hypothetical protein